MAKTRGSPSFGVVFGLLPISLWEAVFFIIPICFIVLISLWTVRDMRLVTQWTLLNYTRIFSKMPYLIAYLRSLGLSLTTVVVSSILAYPLAYAIVFEVSRKYRRLFLVAMILPFWTNYLIRAYSWQIILANNGLLNQILIKLNLIAAPITILYTHVATEVGFTYFYMVLMALLLYSNMETIGPSLLEAAGDLGAGRFKIFMEIIFPLTLPGLTVGSIFVFIMSFGDFVSPAILGGGTKPVFTQMVIDEIQGTVDWPMASALTVVMVVTIVLILVLFLRKVESQKRSNRAR